MKVKEYAEKYQISVSKVYQMIKNEELYAVKNERGHYEIDTARIKFPYLKGMLEEREKIEENIKKCQSLIAKQVEINNTYNQLVDVQDKTEGKVPLCPVQPKIIQQQSAIAQYLQNKLQLFDVKIKPIKDKYEFLEFLLSDLPLENFRPAHSTISVYFEIPTTHLPTLLNRMTQESCAFHFTIQALSELTMLKVRISDHLPNIEKIEEHLLIQFPSAFTGNHNFENQSQGLNQFEQMQLILNEIKKMHTKKKVLWQEEDKKHYLNLILQLKTLPIDALNAKDQTFIQHIYKNSNGYLH